MDMGAWRATVHGVAKSWTRLGDCTFASLSVAPAVIFFLVSVDVSIGLGHTLSDFAASFLNGPFPSK